MTDPPTGEPRAVHPQPSGARLRHLTLLALGVVYGDIGTSPLYAIQQCFYGDHRVPISEANVLGILSLVFWSLVIVISIKYLTYIVRMDNRGEGGILSLMALVRSAMRGRAGLWLVVTLGLFGACLLYADGILTPAISVLGAVEGLVEVPLGDELDHLFASGKDVLVDLEPPLPRHVFQGKEHLASPHLFLEVLDSTHPAPETELEPDPGGGMQVDQRNPGLGGQQMKLREVF